MKKILLGDELLIIFTMIGGTTFGVDIRNVVSIIEPQKIRKVPFAPPYINSIFNYYGRIVTVFDIKRYLEEKVSGPMRNKRVIYLSHPEQHIGILVDSIMGIDYVSPSCIEPLNEEEEPGKNGEFSQGLFILDEDAPGIYWLDTKKVEEFISCIEL